MWIKESARRGSKLKDMYSLSGVDVFIKDKLPEHIDPEFVFKYISSLLPPHVIDGVDIIYIGEFPRFKKDGINAYFEDGAIYVSNYQDDDRDMIDDIIHEIAHSVEEEKIEYIYSDNTLKREFLGKRQRLYHRLKEYDYKPPISLSRNPYYTKEIDMYLYKDVGYEALWNLVVDLFPSPYSVTSLREYFAIGFEYYFMKNKLELKKTCPVLYSKLESIEYMED